MEYDSSYDIVFGNADGHVYRINSTSGKVIWKFNTGSPIFSSPSIQKHQLLIGSHSKYTYVFDLSKNEMISKTFLDATVFSTPVFLSYSEYVVCSTLGKVFLISNSNGEILSAYQLPGEVFSSPVLHRTEVGLIYLIIGSRDNFCRGLKIH